MSKVVQVQAFVYEMDFTGSKEYRVFNTANQSDEWYSLIGPVVIDYEIPEGFNPVASKLAALEKQKQEVRAAYLAKVKEIDERIGNLQALEMTVEA